MYELTVETVFSAAHAIVISGARETLHGHDWRVTACVTGPELDADGLLTDFHAVQHALEEIAGPFRNGNLNEIAPFNRVNPTAEHVARHFAVELQRRLGTTTTVGWVRVTEAAGCAATYRTTPAVRG